MDDQTDHRNAIAALNNRLGYLRGARRSTANTKYISADNCFVPGARMEFAILGVGREEKQPPTPPTDHRLWRHPFEDLIAGAYTYRVPISYRVDCDARGRLAFHMGTWAQKDTDSWTCRRRAAVLSALIGTLYPVVTTTQTRAVAAAEAWGAGGLVTGHPTAKAPVVGDNVLPIDRLIRAMGGRAWSLTLLAAPESEETPQRLSEALIAELSSAQTVQRASGQNLPIVKQLTDLVEPALRTLADASTLGAWRTAIYLQATPETYPILSSVWRGVFSGERSAPETIRVVDLDPQLIAWLAATGAFPLESAQDSPHEYRHPFEYQTLLSCGQLAAYLHLPSVEVPGFWVDAVPRFDVSASASTAPAQSIRLGTVVAHPRGGHDAAQPGVSSALGGTPYYVRTEDLTRHVFIAGLTGTGKTTTSMTLLRALHARQVPFLVIEPAKREYRSLREPLDRDTDSHALSRKLRVYSASSDDGTILAINPFEVEAGTSVTEHIDLLRAVFSASFGDMWTPLPQVLEQCMRKAYQDRGWDLAADRNHRIGEADDPALAYPTLRELAGTVDSVVDTLGFDPEARDRVRGSLATRINGLRTGSKGRLFDTRTSLSMDSLLQQPAVLELERLADESDKAFFIGLLLIRLVELRRGHGRGGAGRRPTNDSLQHVLVIEEAHRLLANVHEGAGDNTSRAGAVEAFSNLLAEIRAYGQAVIVIDQVPTKLAQDVIKNTNLKIAHRTVDEADRKVLGGSMAMSDGQLAGLAILSRGEAAVFSEGEDAPLLIQVTKPKPPLRGEAAHISEASGRPEKVPLSHPHCVCGGGGAPECLVSAEMMEDEEVRNGAIRLGAAALDSSTMTELNVEELRAAIRRESSRGLREELVTQCLAARAAEWVAEDWGARGAWSFGRTSEYADALRRLLIEALLPVHEPTDAAPPESLLVYQRVTRDLQPRRVDPYPSCSIICVGNLAGYCLYRHATAAAVERPDLQLWWKNARQHDARSAHWSPYLQTVADEVLGPQSSSGARRAAALCFTQLAIAAESPRWPPWSREQFVNELVEHMSENHGRSAETP